MEAVAQRCSVKKGRRPATLLEKRLWHRCFPMNCAKFLRAPFLTEHLWWLLLDSNGNMNLEEILSCANINLQSFLNDGT